MAGKFEVSTIFKGIDKISRPVSRMQQSVRGFTRNTERNLKRVTRQLDRMQRGFADVGRKSAIGVAVASAAFARASTAGIDFEQTLVNAAAKFPGEIKKGTDGFNALAEAAKTTGKTTEFSATQSAEALNFLAMAGFNSEQAIASLNGVVDLATAGSVDLGTAADIASDSLGAFNLMTKDSAELQRNLARVNDVLAKTTTSANTTMETMFETIKDGAPVATAAGASIETFAALTGVLANAGIKGTRAGTTLKNMFLSIQAPSNKAASIFQRLGVATQDASGNMLDVFDVLEQLNKGMTGLGDAQRAAALEGIFGKIPIAGVNNLLNAGADNLRAYRKQLEGATGASSEMAAMMRDTTQGSLNSLNSAIEGVSITMFGMTGGPMKEAIDKTTEWVRANGDLIAQNVGAFFLKIVNNLDSIISTAKGIAIVVAALWAFNGVAKTVASTMMLVNAVMLMNPIVLIVAGVVALVAAFVALVYWIDDVIEGFENMAPALQLAYYPLKKLLDGIKYIKDNFHVVTDAANSAASFLGFGNDEEQNAPDGFTGATVSSPQERTAALIQETTVNNNGELVIRDETGRAQLNAPNMRGLSVVSSGMF